MIKTQQQVTLAIDATPEDAWEIIRTGKDVNKWMPQMIQTCEIKGNKRICGTQQGDIVEEILDVDNENKEFKYAFLEQNFVPNIHNLNGYMKVLSNDQGQALIDWKWTFDADDESSAQQAKETFKGAGQMGIMGIETYIKELKG